MSSRYQKEKRFRPRNDPYQRTQFNAGKYTRIERVVVLPPKQHQQDLQQHQEPDETSDMILSGSVDIAENQTETVG